MSDYWIGDWVRIISSGKIGKFEGEINNKAKIKLNNKVVLYKLNDIQLLSEDEIPKSDIAIAKVKEKHFDKPKVYSPVIDLHIEKLAPQMQNELPELIITYQLKRAKFFIEESIDRKQLSITIIHGKGIGALKMEIESLLKSYAEVYFTKSVNDGGALEILFQYR